jgi:hypothetical protein
MKSARLKMWTALLALLLLGGVVSRKPVKEQEALATAELWYTMEINAATTALSPEEKQQRLAARGKHQVQYLVGRDDLRPALKSGEMALAYVVTFEPSGLVVVAGDDSMQPVPVFNATGEFDWQRAKPTYLGYFLGRAMVDAASQIRTLAAGGKALSVHTNWTSLRQQLQQAPGLDATFPTPKGPGPKSAIYVRWPTPAWNQWAHYNNTCVAHNGGNSVPTGCTATAMAIKMRFHEWPPLGSGSHAYYDTWGAYQYYHSNYFGGSRYNWTLMPTNDLTADNADVANLMYDCGVAVGMDYEAGGSGGWPSASSMNTYFRYRGTIDVVSTNPAAHFDAMVYSIRCGLPVVLSSTAHTPVACGYWDSPAPYFFLNCGWGGRGDNWYDLNQVPGGDPTIETSYPYGSPRNYTYADSTYSGTETGELFTPYNTVAEGKDAVPTGGGLWLKAGDYRGPGNTGLILDKAMVVRSCLGTSSVGGN